MLDFTVELHRTNELLERLAVALERLAGPQIEYRQGSPATKIYIPTPKNIQKTKDAKRELASLQPIEPDSIAMEEFVRQVEASVEQLYGPEAVSALPWRIESKKV